MKYFILIMNAIYLWSCIKHLFTIHKTKSLKQSLDESLEKNKTDLKDKNGKTIIITTLVILSMFPLLWLLFCATYVNTFIFAVICLLYAVWSCHDMSNTIRYINDKVISKTLDSKLYKILSLPFDFGFAIFMMYQLFIKW